MENQMSRIPVRMADKQYCGSKLPLAAQIAGFAGAAGMSSGRGDCGTERTAFAGGFAPRRMGCWMAVLLLAGAGAQAQAVFSTPQPVGTMASEQSVIVTAPAGGTVNSVEVLTLGAANLDFQPGTGFTCVSTTPLAASGSCTQSVTFSPTAPGLRVGAVVLLDIDGNVLGTAYISGIGLGGLGVLVPGNISSVAGNGNWLDTVVDGISALLSELDQPTGVTLDGAGNMYIADSVHNRVRMVAAPVPAPPAPPPVTVGIISTIAGNGNASWSGDNGLAVNATLNSPSGVALDGAGNLYIADTANNRVRKIAAVNGIPTGVITTVAGNGTPGYGGDGLVSTSALVELNRPQGVTVDSAGNLYIADTSNQRIRRVDAVTGVITTVAGNGDLSPLGDGEGTYSGDGGPATSAGLNLPYAVAFDSAGGNMYIADSNNNRVRVVNGGTINTYAGTGTEGYTGDGKAATAAELFAPGGVVVDPAGNVYIADTQNESIRKVSATTLNISTIAANGIGEYLNASGQFLPVSIHGPIGLFLDGGGDLYFADSLNNVIREMTSNWVALDFTAVTVRQGSTSAPQNQTVENDGNAPLDLTSISALATNDAALGNATTCAAGSPYLGVNGDCVIGAEFAPSVLLTFPPGTTEEQLTGNIFVAGAYVEGGSVAGATVNSPLNIELVGIASAVNSTTVTLNSSLNPSGFGQSVTISAHVTTGAGTGSLTGTVTFYDGATILDAGVALNSSGIATYTTTTFTVGLHTITAAYSGDSQHYADTSLPLIQTVLESTAINLKSSQNPSSVGQNVIFTATVTSSAGGSIVPDGTVSFADGANPICTGVTLTAGVATCSTATLPQGTNAITATYSGDPANQIQASGPVSLSQDVLAASTTLVSSSPNPSYYGVPVTFTATITPSGAAPVTGTVNFYDGTAKIGSGSIGAGTAVATFTTTTPLAVGPHSITADYLGDTNNGPSNSPAIIQTVNQTATATSVIAVPSPGIAGAPVALTASVTVTEGANPALTGTVTFTSGTTTIGSASVTAAGTATINPILAPGPYSIVATYSGDTDDGGSASAALPLTVVLATTSTALTSSPNPSVVLSAVTFTATVTGNGGVPTGSVNFLANGTSIGTAQLIAGTATLTYSALPASTTPYSITAVYGGDANDSGSISATLSQVVNTIPTYTSLGTSTTGGTTPQVILVATVVGTTGPTPTGMVTFTSGATVLGSAPLDADGVAILVPNLGTGSYTIVASYSGDSLHSPSASSATTVSSTATDYSLTVTPATVTMATTQNATVTVTLTSDAGFADTIGLGCASLPAGVTCHFASINVALTSGAVQTTQLTIDTNNPLSGGASPMNAHPGSGGVSLAGLLLPLGAFFGWVLWRFRRRHFGLLTTVLVLLLSGAAMLATGCSGFTQSSAAPGTYVIQVVGVGANSDVSHYQNVTLNITK
jgi:large repetitive protein